MTIAGPIASLMIEKYLRKKITRTDLETRVLNISLKDRYNTRRHEGRRR
jgi:penicillin-binding protein 2